MKRPPLMTSAQKIIWRISELRDLSRRLSLAGYRAGLHPYDPNQLPSISTVTERCGKYSTRLSSK